MALTGDANLTVTFVDASTPADDITYWLWDFGDGSAYYEGQTPPAHLYDTPGVYTVTLHVASAKGIDTFSDTVDVGGGTVQGSITGDSAPIEATVELRRASDDAILDTTTSSVMGIYQFTYVGDGLIYVKATVTIGGIDYTNQSVPAYALVGGTVSLDVDINVP